MKRMKQIIAVVLCLVLVLSMVPAVAAEAQPDTTVYKLASTISADKDYVIVTNGYALTNKVSGNTLAGTKVTLDGDNLVSPVTDDMIWHFIQGSSNVCGDYTTGYFLQSASGGYLARASSNGGGSAPLNTTTYDASNVSSKPEYCYWVVQNDLHYQRKSLFLVNYSSSTNYSFIMQGGETFQCPGCSHANEKDICQQSLLRIYEVCYAPECEHSFTDKVVPVTCVDRGYTEHTCTKCGWVYVDSYVHPLDHEWGKGTVSAADPDVTVSKCTRCGQEKTVRAHKNPNQILFISDLHSGYYNYDGFHNLKAMLPQLQNEGLYPEVITGGGDYAEALLSEHNDFKKTYEALTYIIDQYYPESARAWTTGNHEWELAEMSDKYFEEVFGCPRVGLNYANDTYEIFQIGAQGNTSNVDKEMFWDEDIEALDRYLASRVGTDKIIFIQTHWPLHWADNWGSRTIQGADKMIDTINRYGDDLNIFFIWGHNHYTDAMRHKVLQYGDTINYTQSAGKQIKFTYANAGCMNNYHDYWQGDTTTHFGPGVCLSAELTPEDITFTYNRIDNAYFITGTGRFSHDADLKTDAGVVRENPAVVTVALRDPVCDHDFDVTVTEPTCTEGGYSTKVCKLCGRTVTADYTEPLDHDWDNGTVTTPATEDARGLMTYSCKRCDATKTKIIPRLNSVGPDDIDFTDPASAELFEIVNQSASAIREGEGLYMISSREAIEPCNGQNSGDQANTPKDLVKVPVWDDWTATLEFVFDQASAANGYYQFFGFYAAEGEDYQNLAGIRGGDGAMQNFLRVKGNITADTEGMNSTPGLASNGTYWYQIQKDGTTYICSRSSDGESFTEMFRYTDTGIDADSILIDAYTGMTAGYTFMLKSLTFEAPEPCQHEYKAVPVLPTCENDGYTVYTCVKCEESYTDNVIPATGHKFENGKCTVCGKADPNWVEPKTCPSEKYVDAPEEGNWAHAGIDFCIENGLMNGTSDTAFSPKDSMTRAMVVTVLWRQAGSPEPKKAAEFDDLTQSWYMDAVAWAAENGVVNGVGGTRFAPGDPVTREQMATILQRYTSNILKKNTTKTTDISGYPDFADVSSFAVAPMAWANAEGLITGSASGGETFLRPKDGATREQVATILMRFVQNFAS